MHTTHVPEEHAFTSPSGYHHPFPSCSNGITLVREQNTIGAMHKTQLALLCSEKGASVLSLLTSVPHRFERVTEKRNTVAHFIPPNVEGVKDCTE